MNERIKLLAEQAGITTNLDTDYYEKDMNKWVDYFSEKFAELIVRECATLAFDGPNGILEHFGVDDNSIKVGSRIKVVSKFNVGARGTVNYIEPSGKLWVRRDGASSDVSYYPTEVIGDDSSIVKEIPTRMGIPHSVQQQESNYEHTRRS